MAEPKLQGFSQNYTKPCRKWREKLPLIRTKSMASELFRANHY
jgi:hypothetical protein